MATATKKAPVKKAVTAKKTTLTKAGKAQARRVPPKVAPVPAAVPPTPEARPRKAHVRMLPEERRKLLDSALLTAATTHGFNGVTRVTVAAAAGVSDGLINRYYTNREGLLHAVIEKAISARNAKILADAFLAGWNMDAFEMSRALQHEVKALMAKA